MNLEELIGKQVVDSQAHILGKVFGIEFDTSTWKIMDICIDLDKTVVEIMGFQKPRVIGSVKVSIPVEEVNAIHDIITLKKNTVELKSTAKKI